MAALTQARQLDFGGCLPADAREAIREELAEDPKATRRVYAALARKVWSLLIERRFDDEIRDWHALLGGVKAKVRRDDVAAAERISALSDLLRESISLADTSPARDMAERPRAKRILGILKREPGFVSRRVLKDEIGIGNSHLSNVLTQLVAHNLIERRDQGKEAEFQLTPFGRQVIRDKVTVRQPEAAEWAITIGFMKESIKAGPSAGLASLFEEPEADFFSTVRLREDVERLTVPMIGLGSADGDYHEPRHMRFLPGHRHAAARAFAGR